MDRSEALNSLIARMSSRAENLDPRGLEKAFVEVEQITDALRCRDNQILYGRRGTGKTHTFYHLANQLDADDELIVNLDLRRLGSNGGLYSDDSETISLRGTQLLIDILESIHDELYMRAVSDGRFDGLLNVVDSFLDASTRVEVKGEVSESEESARDTTSESGGRASLQMGTKSGLQAAFEASDKSASKEAVKKSRQRTGIELPRVLFGPLGRAAEDICEAIKPHRVWLLLDEWNAIPIALQPVVADMLRRTFFPSRGWVVKIGAIERRSSFYLQRPGSTDYIGLEPSSDTGASLILDEHLQAAAGDAARLFFAELIFRHMKVVLAELGKGMPYASADALISDLCQPGAFGELVRAAEGIPRDAIQLIGMAARFAGRSKVQRGHVREAAQKHFMTDKEIKISQNKSALSLWRRIQGEVVAERRSRTFLVKRTREKTPTSLQDLHDARLIHLIQPGLPVKGSRGVTYDGYAVDYGSYVKVLEEEEIDAAWDARNYPWMFDSGGFTLSASFDETKVLRVHGRRDS
ncbi:hypothetical protein [Streptomyces sp. TRM49041]|uniref:ORC-CDC6 family AAA ATPase n=1 Tax=Streptomyces sp. TRM49041 TaxID=2603216 RepID=UPI0011EE19A4|nr:hypothetical protein [Streptomyces sp. TRM49041]